MQLKCDVCRQMFEPGPGERTCDRCRDWQEKCSWCGTQLTVEELLELEDYSRFIYSLPPDADQIEYEQASKSFDQQNRLDRYARRAAERKRRYQLS